MLKTAPAVFAVGNEYEIMVSVTAEALFWVRVGDTCYYDESNGVMRSLSELHRVKVPVEQLDKERQYTVCVRPLVERRPYFSETAEVQEFVFSFSPVPAQGARLYHMADAHDRIDQPVQAAKTFGDIDLLILNGDIISDSGDPARFHNIYEICSRLTGGEHPTVFFRGNHDMRGGYAERFAEYTPNHLGNTYYTFRVGSLWGILLDCGEDKRDDCPEYGYTVRCREFRRRQTAFIKDVITRSEQEYAAPGVTTRLVISHHPFTHKIHAPFDIEGEVYTEWAALLKEHVKPHLMLCGHLHRLGVWEPGCEDDTYGQPCTVIVGSAVEENTHTGCGIVLNEGSADVTFVDSDGNTVSKHAVIYGV